MEWSKAKNILIVLILVVDMFLLGTYIFRTKEESNEQDKLRTDVCNVLQNQGINISKDMIPSDSTEFSPAIIRVCGKDDNKIGSLLGAVTEIASDEYTTFSGENGTFMFAKDSFSLVYESGKPILGNESAKALAVEIASALSVKASEKDFGCQKTDGGYTVIIPQVFSGIELFDCSIEIKISESGSVIASGNYICKGDMATYSEEVLPASAVMFSFADAVKEKGIEEVKVLKIRKGYTAKASDGKRLSLAPTLGIDTDRGTFLVDMQTEKVSVK